MDKAYLVKQRENRQRTGNAATKKYEKTIGGKLIRSYRNMMSRVSGIQWRKSHIYDGLELIDRETFYKFSLEDSQFLELYKNWVQSGYDRKLSPSIDRIDSQKGYVLGNIRWITHSENSRLGAISRHHSNKVISDKS